MLSVRQLLLLCPLLSLPLFAANVAAQAGSETFGDYQVHYSVFNSTFIKPDIASTYQVNRARNQALVNISVMHTEDGNTSLGQPAKLSGTATNLIQQEQTLNFREISDGQATYYIAPVRHIDEEVHNFRIRVQPEGTDQSFELRFTQKLYLDR